MSCPSHAELRYVATTHGCDLVGHLYLYFYSVPDRYLGRTNTDLTDIINSSKGRMLRFYFGLFV